MIEVLTRFGFLPLHENLRRRRTLTYFRRLCKTVHCESEEILRHQWAKLRKLLEHCANEVPYYQRLFQDVGIDAFDNLSLKEYKSVPTLTKDDIRSNLEELVAKSYRHKVIRYNTGGSTGAPLVFYTDRDKEAHHNAQKLRARSWFGILLGDRQVDFWGSPIELNKMSKFRAWKDRWLLNHVLLSAFDLTEERLKKYCDLLEAYRPRLIYGYPTVIYRLAQFVQESPSIIGEFRPRLISCTSEMLYEHQRRVMAEAFKCPVVNEYGSRDGGLIAHECPHRKLHIAAEHVLVEVDNVDDDGVGDLLVTNLDGYGMPLLRYRIGDRGKLSSIKCTCGLPLPVLEQLAGRSNDFLVGRNGKLIHSLAPIYVLRDLSKLRQFKIVQRKGRHLRIEMVCPEGFTEEELEQIRQQMTRVFDFDIAVEFVFKECILPEKSGKYRWVVSEAEEATV